MLDHEGFLAFFKGKIQDGKKVVMPGERIFKSVNGIVYDRHQQVAEGESDELRLNPAIAGSSGRRKICFADWNNDGKDDLILNSKPNISWLENVGNDVSRYLFKKQDAIGKMVLAGHTTSPTVVDWNNDGVDDLLVGAEDGCLYYVENPLSKY
jgi:hypothetical protein